MNTQSAKLDKTAKAYIINCISDDGFNNEDGTPTYNTDTEQDKVTFLFNTLLHAKDYEFKRNNINKTDIIEDWLRGLPSSINIEFSNYDILQLAKKWGSIPQDATEKQEDKILENYWHFIANKTRQLFTKYSLI